MQYDEQSNSTPSLGLVWFTDDLRLDDNALLSRAAMECDNLIICFFIDPTHFKQDMYGCQRLGLHRRQFLSESLLFLRTKLEALGQRLNIFLAKPLSSIEAICAHLPVTHIYRSTPVAFNESRDWLHLRASLPDIRHVQAETRCLFEASDIEFSSEPAIATFPKTFSQFRRKVENIQLRTPASTISALPEPVSLKAFNFPLFEPEKAIKNTSPLVHGGEAAALDHLTTYFSGNAPNHYKQTRNAFDDWESSSKWSFWLANGSLSVRRTVQALEGYQAQHGKNEDNAWLLFELLWREYFQWYARAFNKRLFLLNGLFTEANARKQRGSFYAQRYRQWCMGTTPYPIVNACMRQLNETGYMSNRGRQIAASALINELGLDWRCGAAYFEQQLIDYDPASNWGNWQYIAGVGADPRGGRHFNLEKQAQMHDADGRFRGKWTDSDDNYSLDYVDAADWPIPRR
ncbi:hypothetical protein A3758_10355 [Oleiphilus sp. HI0118]|nr:hypothetical protein A3758_10355 [Oleiphilus sp. HI0118]